jgi:nitrate reductase gamma subunit
MVMAFIAGVVVGVAGLIGIVLLVNRRAIDDPRYDPEYEHRWRPY